MKLTISTPSGQVLQVECPDHLDEEKVVIDGVIRILEVIWPKEERR